MRVLSAHPPVCGYNFITLWEGAERAEWMTDWQENDKVRHLGKDCTITNINDPKYLTLTAKDGNIYLIPHEFSDVWIEIPSGKKFRRRCKGVLRKDSK
jgi:hypothetical protein